MSGDIHFPNCLTCPERFSDQERLQRKHRAELLGLRPKGESMIDDMRREATTEERRAFGRAENRAIREEGECNMNKHPRLVCPCGNDRWLPATACAAFPVVPPGYELWECDKCGCFQTAKKPRPTGQVVYLEEEDDESQV